MKKEKNNFLIGLVKYLLIPFFIGWCIPTFTTFTENYTFMGIKDIGYVTKNFQYTMSLSKCCLIFFIGFCIYCFEKSIWKNKKSINDKYYKAAKYFCILVSFFIGMNIKDFIGQLKELINFSTYSEFFIIYILIFLVLSILYLTFLEEINNLFKIGENNNDDKPKKILIQSREHKKVLLLNALKTSERILVDAEWGKGKTTFVDITLDEAQELYHKIKIDILVFNNREKIKNEFLNQIKPILKVEKIYFKNMNEYLGFINNIGSIWSKFIKSTFYENDSFESAKESLKNDLGLLKKNIVIIFDNLERIVDENLIMDREIKEIIGFIHEIGELDKIKSIIIADYDKLTKSDDKDRAGYHKEYLEKFYDYRIKLKDCSLEELVEAKRKENDFDYGVIKEIANAIYDVLNTENKAIDFSGNNQKEEEDRMKKVKDEIEKAISNPRMVEKIICTYKVIKGEQIILEELLSSIFMVIYFEIWDKADAIEDIKNKTEVKVIFSKKTYSNGQIGKRWFTNEDYHDIDKILFYEKDKIVQSEEFVKNFDDKKILKIQISSDLEKLELYYKFNNDIGIVEKIYKKIVDTIKEMIEKKELTSKEFIRIINTSFIWKMEYELYKDDEGDIVKFIKKMKIEDYEESKGIDFYILNSYSEIFEMFFNLETEYWEYDFSDKYSFYNKKEEKSSYFFPNYKLFAEEIEKITGKKHETRIFAVDYMKSILKSIIDKESDDTNVLLNDNFNIMLERLECFFKATDKIYQKEEKDEHQEYEEKLLKLENLNIEDIIKEFSVSLLSNEKEQQDKLINIYKSQLSKTEITSIQKLKIKSILSYINKTIKVRECKKEVDNAIYEIDKDKFKESHEKLKKAVGKENPYIIDEPLNKFNNIWGYWERSEKAIKEFENLDFEDKIRQIENLDINQEKIKSLRKLAEEIFDIYKKSKESLIKIDRMEVDISINRLKKYDILKNSKQLEELEQRKEKVFNLEKKCYDALENKNIENFKESYKNFKNEIGIKNHQYFYDLLKKGKEIFGEKDLEV